MEALLLTPADAGNPNPILKENGGCPLEDRPDWDWHVVRIQEECETVLIAARKRMFKKIEILHAENCMEKPYPDNGRQRIAQTRLLI